MVGPGSDSGDRRRAARLARTGLRIVAGTLKGRRLETPDWTGLRPTSDRLRETLFNVLGQDLTGWRVLDGFAGTGAVGIEALSRGAAFVLFVDDDPRAIELISRNLARCGVTGQFDVQRVRLGERGPKTSGEAFDLVFLDPPYDISPVAAVEQLEPLLATPGLLVLEYARGREAPARIGALERVREVVAGSSALGFYRRRVRRDQDEALAS